MFLSRRFLTKLIFMKLPNSKQVFDTLDALQ